MSEKALRKKLIRLAHTNPDLRPDLLPLIQKRANAAWYAERVAKTWMEEFSAERYSEYEGQDAYKEIMALRDKIKVQAELVTRDALALTRSSNPKQFEGNLKTLAEAVSRVVEIASKIAL